MEFGLDKWAKATFKAGKFVKSSKYTARHQHLHQELNIKKVYKLLGIQEENGLQQSKMT